MKKLLQFSAVSLLLVLFSVSEILPQWTAQTPGITSNIYSIKAINDNVVWAAGSAGNVLRTVNGGTTWVKVTSPNTSLRCYSLDAVDSSTAWVSMTNATSGVDYRVYKTTNGGSTWTQQYANAGNFGDAIKMLDANFGVAYSDPYPASPGTDWEIIVTTNGGTNWTKLPNTAYPPALSGEYGLNGSIAGIGSTVWFGTNMGRIYRSLDKGNTWTVSVPDTGYHSTDGIDFKDANTGVSVNSNGQIIRTTNGGTSWSTPQTQGTDIFFACTAVPGTNKFIAVGLNGAAYMSNDNGATWTATTTGTTLAFLSVDATGSNAWASGQGIIYKWTGAPLPVELTSFTASAKGKVVDLKWNTATEINNKGFEIERKAIDNSSSWATVGFKSGNGTTTEAKSYSFVDDLSSQTATSFSYRLKQVDLDGTFKYSQEVNVEINNLPTEFSVSQNYPNPFNPSTKIKYAVPSESNVKLTIYNALGQKVSELLNSVQAPGFYEMNFDAANLSSGLYFYNIEANALDGSGSFTQVKKMMLVR